MDNEISKNNFFHRTLPVAASPVSRLYLFKEGSWLIAVQNAQGFYAQLLKQSEVIRKDQKIGNIIYHYFKYMPRYDNQISTLL